MKNSRHNDSDVLDRQQRLGFKRYLDDLKEQATHIEDDEEVFDADEAILENISMSDLVLTEGDTAISRTINVQGRAVSIQEHDWEIIRTLSPREEYCMEETGHGDVWVTLTDDDYMLFESGINTEEFGGRIDNITLVNEFDIGE